MENSDTKQKVVAIFVGPPSCGKSCLVNGYTPDYKSTIGVDFAKKTYIIDGKQVQFMLWDISASMTFNDKNLDQCKRGEVIVCVYDLSKQESFNDCQKMAERLLQENKVRYNGKFILVGTKNDLPRDVSFQDGMQAALILKGNYQSPTQTYYDVSSKTDPNAIQTICRGIYKVHKDPTIKTASDLQQSYNPKMTAPSQISAVANPISIETKKAHVVEQQFSKLYKMLLMGNEKCGKTSIVSQFARCEMSEEYMPTIGVDFAIKTIQVQGEKVKLQIWDTAGMKKFQTITSAYIKGCHAIFIVFDCNNYQTFADIHEHIENINKFSFDTSKICKFIVGNKIDLPRNVPKLEAQNYAKMNDYQYIEVSALQNINLDALFYQAADWLLKRDAANTL